MVPMGVQLGLLSTKGDGLNVTVNTPLGAANGPLLVTNGGSLVDVTSTDRLAHTSGRGDTKNYKCHNIPVNMDIYNNV